MPRYLVKAECSKCKCGEEYLVDADNEDDAEMSMVNFELVKEWLGRMDKIEVKLHVPETSKV